MTAHVKEKQERVGRQAFKALSHFPRTRTRDLQLTGHQLRQLGMNPGNDRHCNVAKPD